MSKSLILIFFTCFFAIALSASHVPYLQKDGKYIYVDPLNMKPTIKGNFDRAFPILKNEKSGVALSGEKYLIIDQKGKILMYNIDAAFMQQEGFVRILKDGKFSFIDENGGILGNTQYQEAMDFKEGKAAVLVMGKWGYINTKGEMVIPPKYDNARSFNEGIAGIAEGVSWGYIDGKGNYLIKPRYLMVTDFAEGKAGILNDEYYIYINRNDKRAFPGRFSEVSNFNDGYAIVRTGPHWLVIDTTGKQAFDTLLNIGTFTDGIAPVNIERKCGFINPKGEPVIPLKYDAVTEFNLKGYAMANDGKNWFYIDRKGREFREK